MDRIEQGNEAASGVGPAAAVNFRQGSQSGKFGSRRVSETLEAPGPYFRDWHETGKGVERPGVLRGIRLQVAADVPSSSRLSGATAMPHLNPVRCDPARQLQPMPPPLVPIPSGSRGSLIPTEPGNEGFARQMLPMPSPLLPIASVTFGAAAQAVEVGERVDANRLAGLEDTAAAGMSPGYRREWTAFCRWCRGWGQNPLPADAGTVAEYLRHRGTSLARSSIEHSRRVIARVHRNTGLENPCESDHVQAAMRELRGARSPFSPAKLDPDSVAAIRSSAQRPRRRGAGQEIVETARKRGLIDIALCSTLYETGLSIQRLTKLEWRDLEKLSDGAAALTVRPEPGVSDPARTIVLIGQVVRDLEAIRGDAGEQARIFGLGAAAAYRRVNSAAQAAGLC